MGTILSRNEPSDKYGPIPSRDEGAVSLHSRQCQMYKTANVQNNPLASQPVAQSASLGSVQSCEESSQGWSILN